MKILKAKIFKAIQDCKLFEDHMNSQEEAEERKAELAAFLAKHSI